MQCDELWSFVDHKGNKQWVWLALDADPREMIGAHVGNRGQRVPSSFGDRCRQSIGSVTSSTRMRGKPAWVCAHQSDIEWSAKTAVKPIILSDSTVLCASASTVCAAELGVLKNYAITSACFGTSFTTTTHHDLFSTPDFRSSVNGVMCGRCEFRHEVVLFR